MTFHGFDVASPESVGVPSASIMAFMDRLKEEGRNVQGFMLYRHGKLIAKCIAPPYDFNSKRHVYSISKTFTSTAIGIARDEGLLTLNERLVDIFPDSLPETISPNLAKMTIHDVLCMGCGHPKNAEPEMMAAEDGDWVKAFLSLDVPYVPGTHFAYNSGATYMLSAIITKRTGMKLIDYLRPRLFEPLGITDVAWDECPRGINLGGWGFRASLVDMLKLGVLYLNGGCWNGRRIVSRDWVKLASSYKISNGVDRGDDWGSGYCYQIWRCQHNCFRGDGAFGQLLIVSPDRDMVLSFICEDNSFQDMCNVYWETIFESAKQNLNTYRMDPLFTEDLTKDDVLPEDPISLAKLREKEENWTSMLELLGGSEGSFAGKLTVEESAVSTVDVKVEGDTAVFTLFFRNGLVKMVKAGNGTWAENRFDEFPRTAVEAMVANHIAPVDLAASFRMEGEKIFVNVQALNSPHALRFAIELEAGEITRTADTYTATYKFTKAE